MKKWKNEKMIKWKKWKKWKNEKMKKQFQNNKNQTKTPQKNIKKRNKKMIHESNSNRMKRDDKWMNLEEIPQPFTWRLPPIPPPSSAPIKPTKERELK